MLDEPLAADEEKMLIDSDDEEEICYSSDFYLYEARFKQKFRVLRCYSADIFHRLV